MAEIEKEFKLEEFIKCIICDQLKKLVYEAKNVSPYLKFISLPQYIEFLGACIDEDPFIDNTKSKTRFKKVIEKYFKQVNPKYQTYNGTNINWDLFDNFRCGIVHQLRPTNKIGLTTREEATLAENKHLEIDKENGEYLIMILEDLYDDIEKVSNLIIANYKSGNFSKKVNDKWTASHISVIKDGGIEE